MNNVLVARKIVTYLFIKPLPLLPMFKVKGVLREIVITKGTTIIRIRVVVVKTIGTVKMPLNRNHNLSKPLLGA